MALDNFLESPNLTSVQLEATIGLPRGFKNYAMVIFHPDPSEREIASQIIESILIVLKQRGIPACVGYPNTDPANFGVIKMIESFSHDDNFFIYRNLGRVEFISLYKNARLIIGNSSSGILEAASIPIPAVNVGLRQRGRTCGRNVIFCDADFASIEQAVVKATDPVFLESLAGLANPYGVGDSSQLAHRLLMDNDFDKIRLKTEDALGSVDEMCL
jgi:UDP-N-acetylglucosamine 2-epimerase